MRSANAKRGTLLFENVMKRFWDPTEDRRMTHHAQPGLVRRLLRTDERGPEDSCVFSSRFMYKSIPQVACARGIGSPRGLPRGDRTRPRLTHVASASRPGRRRRRRRRRKSQTPSGEPCACPPSCACGGCSSARCCWTSTSPTARSRSPRCRAGGSPTIPPVRRRRRRFGEPLDTSQPSPPATSSASRCAARASPAAPRGPVSRRAAPSSAITSASARAR